MKYIVFVLLFLLNILFSFSQNKEQDLKNTLEKNVERDSVRIYNLIEYARLSALNNDKDTKVLIEEAIEISKEINLAIGLGDSFAAYSLFFVRKGLYDKGLLYAEKAKTIQDSIHDKNGLIATNTSIANVYNELHQPKKAIEILLENLKLVKDGNSKKAALHFYLASSYQELKKFERASYHYKAAKKNALKNNFPTGVAIANSALGTLETRKKNYTKALTYLENSLSFYKEYKREINIAHTYVAMSNALTGLDKLEEAIQLNNKAIAIYKEQEILKGLHSLYLRQSNLYTQKENYKKANNFLNKHYQVKDSIFSKDKIRVIEEMKTKYETKKISLEKEVAIITSNKNKNLLWSAMVISTLFLLTILFYFGRYKAKKKNELVISELKQAQKRLALEKQYRTSELKALKAQMDPHFIFNTLNSIQEYIVLNQKELASDYLGKFADLMRKYLKYSDKGEISINEEIETLKMYLELEKVRFEDTLNYQFIIKDHLDTSDFNIPTMLIQPYIENALKHGLLHRKNNRELSISFSKKEKNIQCIIKDNGVGRKKSKEIQNNKPKLHKSFATKATQERLKLLNYGKDAKIGVKIIDLYSEDKTATGTQVVLIIPQIK